MNKHYAPVVFLGPPACGKGTTASWLSEAYHFTTVSPGHIFRQIMAEASPLGDLVRDSLKDGGYCPDDVTNEVVEQEVVRQRNAGSNGAMLDGYPRSMAQLDYLCDKYEVGVFLYLNSNPAALAQMAANRRECASCKKTYSLLRLDQACGCLPPECGLVRWDDYGELYQRRYLTYQNLTLPIIQYLKDRSNFICFDVMFAPQHTVKQDLLAKLEPFLVR